MTKISQYPEITLLDVNDLLIGTDVENSNDTKNFSIQSIFDLQIASNTTTTSLSSSELGSLYEDAFPGFKVQCLDIISGALIYEKTSSGWISYSVTEV
jgi:hypothetical protein